jgi:hypothetical protein
MDLLEQGPDILTGADYNAAVKLALVASKLYESEDLRVQAVNEVLEDILRRPMKRIYIRAGKLPVRKSWSIGAAIKDEPED